jgi:hypothetical protein
LRDIIKCIDRSVVFFKNRAILKILCILFDALLLSIPSGSDRGAVLEPPRLACGFSSLPLSPAGVSHLALQSTGEAGNALRFHYISLSHDVNLYMRVSVKE